MTRFLRRLLTHIYSQPTEAKSRYAFAAASLVTGVIAVIWISTVPSRFAALTPADPRTDEGSTAQDFLDAFNHTTDTLGSVIAGQADATKEPSSSSTLPEAAEPIPGALGSLGSDAGTSSDAVLKTREDHRTILIGTSTETAP